MRPHTPIGAGIVHLAALRSPRRPITGIARRPRRAARGIRTFRALADDDKPVATEESVRAAAAASLDAARRSARVRASRKAREEGKSAAEEAAEAAEAVAKTASARRLATRARLMFDERAWLKARGHGERLQREKERARVLRSWFRSLDSDGSGEIGVRELEDPLIAVGLAKTRQEVVDLIARVDHSGNGEISFEEFLSMIKLNRGKNAIVRLFHAVRAGTFGDSKEVPFAQLITTHRRKMLMAAQMAKDPRLKSEGQRILAALVKCQEDGKNVAFRQTVRRGRRRKRIVSDSLPSGRLRRLRKESATGEEEHRAAIAPLPRKPRRSHVVLLKRLADRAW